MLGLSAGAASTEGATAELSDGYSAALGAALECRWVSCAVLGAAGTQGSSLQWQGGGEGASSLPRLCHDLSSQACSSSCCKAATAALHQEASLKVLVLKLCGEEKKWDGI